MDKSKNWDILEDPEFIDWAEEIDIQDFHEIFDYFLKQIFQLSNEIPKKEAAKCITSFCRCMISDKQKRGNYDDVHMFCKLYRTHSEEIKEAAGFVDKDEFYLFSVPMNEKDETKDVIKKIPNNLLHKKKMPAPVINSGQNLIGVTKLTSVSMLPKKALQLQQIFRRGFASRRHLHAAAIYMDDYSIDYLKLENKTRKNIKKFLSLSQNPYY